ncbi:MAG TPA: hypothetical protein VEP66_13015 [Myxococcales bacterium]|nr:hypothetical protein [Myxococcales bacterium]
MTGITRVFVACAAVCACTSVKMVQREGCWVKQTERTLGGTTEELGFCTKARPEWAEDRLARLVQECMAQADYRWENRALAAWTRGEPIPPQDSDDQIAKTCMSQASTALGLEAQNDALKSRLSDVSQDREALRTNAEKDRVFLEQSSDKMITALGEAAKKPPPSAVATATSTGTAKTESDQRSAQQPEPPPTTVVLAPPATTTVIAAPALPAAPATPRAAKAPCAPKAKTAKPAEKGAPACEKQAAPAPQTADATAARADGEAALKRNP